MPAKNPRSDHTANTLYLPPHSRILGHRGARGEQLENTLAGFIHAQSLRKQGLAGVEFDVQLTKDGRLVVFHDDTLERLCRLQSRVETLTLNELAAIAQRQQSSQYLSYSASSPPSSNASASSYLAHPIITLDSMVDELQGYGHIELEIKTHHRSNPTYLTHALADYLSDSQFSQLPLVLTSFDTTLLAHLQRHPTLQQYPRGRLTESALTSPQSLPTLLNASLQLGCVQVGFQYTLLTPAIIRECHRYGLKVTAWTVNNLQSAVYLLDGGVDTVITDFPSQFLKQLP